MPDTDPTLHLIAGKIGAGKSTLAAKLGEAPGTVVISEDQWLAAMYGDTIRSIADYVRSAGRLRTAMEPHVVDLLRNGLSVVLDFPANTRETRAWMQTLIAQSGCAHQLHYLEVPDDVCRARLRARNAAGTHPFSPTEEQFDRITQHFVPPSEDEGFDILVHRQGETEN